MWYSYRELIFRVGTFFILLGIGLVLLFMLTEAGGQVIFDYFCWGILLLVIGFFFRNQYKKSAEPSQRFSLWKRLFSKKSK